MKRRRHRANFKAKVALAALRGEQTITEIAMQHDIHPGQVQAWKATALENFEQLFQGHTGNTDNREQQMAALERKVGQLSIENDFLKKTGRSTQRRAAKND